MEKQQKQCNKGITLIALVITIIVLLILAGVSIATLAGENGIMNRASEAKEDTNKAKALEQVQMAVMGSREADKIINNDTLKVNLEKIENITDIPFSITSASYPVTVAVDGYEVTIKSDGSVVEGRWTPGEAGEDGIFTVPSTIDGAESGSTNPMIPAGFKPVNTDTSKWKDENGNIVVKENVGNGMVIEDKYGNQYVWIPVDGLMGRNKTVTNAVEGEVILGRYVFNNDGTINETLTPDALDKELKPTQASGDRYKEDYSTLEGFIESVEENGGYYIARYEASKGTETKVGSKYGQEVWNRIEQSEAVSNSQGLYKTVNSALMNSYAFDTVLLFIQKQNSAYSIEQSKNAMEDGLLKTGESGDVVCNIYDLASNCYEWTTEIKNNSRCVRRGDAYSSNEFCCTSTRQEEGNTTQNESISFRTILYLESE